jgi:site-specific recombinase XerC
MLGAADRNRAILLLLVDNRNHRILVMGKGSKERPVQFSARTGQAIWRYLANRPETGPTDPLFTTHDGHPIDRDYLRHVIIQPSERSFFNSFAK